eukprot:jgi/Botrbrau1/1289/Bobra.0063s0006.1
MARVSQFLCLAAIVSICFTAPQIHASPLGRKLAQAGVVGVSSPKAALGPAPATKAAVPVPTGATGPTPAAEKAGAPSVAKAPAVAAKPPTVAAKPPTVAAKPPTVAAKAPAQAPSIAPPTAPLPAPAKAPLPAPLTAPAPSDAAGPAKVTTMAKKLDLWNLC